MKKRMSFVCILLCCLIGFAACAPENKISLLQDESFFSDFEIKDGTVFIECMLIIENKSDKDCTFTISADFEKDVKVRLLKESVLYVRDEKGEKQKFTLPAHAKQPFTCIFSGEFGGVNQKADRLLPDKITFHIE